MLLGVQNRVIIFHHNRCMQGNRLMKIYTKRNEAMYDLPHTRLLQGRCVFTYRTYKRKNKLKQAEEKNRKEEAKKLDELMKVPTIKLAYNELEIANSKLIATAEKMEQLSKTSGYSQDKLNMFLNKTQNEIEMNKLKTEYNKVARECLLKLTKFRINVQNWGTKYPQYAKVADYVLTGAEWGARSVAGVGIFTAFVGTASISIPVAITGTGITVAKDFTVEYVINNYIKNPLIKYASQQGKTFREKAEFEETARWIIDGIFWVKKAKTTISGIKNYKNLFSQKFTKTYINKFDKYGEFAFILREASRNYYKSNKEQLVNDVLRIIADG